MVVFGAISGSIGAQFGVRYVFLTPEYVGQVSPLSYFIVGLAFGAFLFSWNLSIYLLSAFRFPFLATMKRPFLKFCINNGLLPLIMIGAYLFYILKFQRGYLPLAMSFMHVASLLAGLSVFIFSIIGYFRMTNKDIFSFLKARKEKPDMAAPVLVGQRMNKNDFYNLKKRSWRVDTFVSEKLKLRIVRGIGHYDVKILMKVFRQNHINVILIQLLSILILMGLGFMMENKYFRIPTAASLFILFSILISIVGAIGFWFHRWKIIVWILVIFGMNNITKYDFFDLNCKAYGLSYKDESIMYNNIALEQISKDSILEIDRKETIEILNNWRAKFPKEGKKPKLILLSASGGGQKASLWTMQILQSMDKLTEEQFFEHTAMISGASGGMLGAAYYRELMLRKRQGGHVNPQAAIYSEKIAKDLLNSIYFSIVTNDIFIPMATARRNGREHRRDRGYMFELQFNENTDSLLEKPISAYRLPEYEAIIPRIILSPSVINDGRRLIISPFNSSYMMSANFKQYRKGGLSLDAIDFRRLFAEKEADSLSFVSALRMNATYPIVLPSVNLPSVPSLEISDAGFRDNLGKATTMRFASNFMEWIKENTSGVIFVQIAGWEKFNQSQSTEKTGWISSLFKPFGILADISTLQDYDSDINYGLLSEVLGNENVDIVRFEYVPSAAHRRASMSFHLTELEKEDISKSINSSTNQQAQEKLMRLLE